MNETAIQRAVFSHFRQRAAKGVFAFHVPMGGYRRRTEAAILNGMGAKAGVPDICAIKDGKAYFLELKAEGGKLTEKQEQVLTELRSCGAMATHAHGLDQALRILEGWQLLRGTS